MSGASATTVTSSVWPATVILNSTVVVAETLTATPLAVCPAKPVRFDLDLVAADGEAGDACSRPARPSGRSAEKPVSWFVAVTDDARQRQALLVRHLARQRARWCPGRTPGAATSTTRGGRPPSSQISHSSVLLIRPCCDGSPRRIVRRQRRRRAPIEAASTRPPRNSLRPAVRRSREPELRLQGAEYGLFQDDRIG